MTDSVKFILPDNNMPTAWYNLFADLNMQVKPPLHPQTLQPVTPDDLLPLFPPSLIEQEVTGERFIDIPGPVLDAYRLWRPTPLVRALKLEQALNTGARIYYKYEGCSPAGSHKPNTAVPQAYYNKQDGTKRLTTETGAGQWGSALSLACSLFDLECSVYMVRISYDQKPYRRTLMQVYRASVLPSPSDQTAIGRKFLADDPDCPGSLGIAISEAIEHAASDDTARYSLGSVLNHVLIHQSVIGLETIEQLDMAGDTPDYVIGCFGGGSNFAGLTFPFLAPNRKQKPQCIAVEPAACPTLTRGKYVYDYGDAGRVAPVTLMHTLGHSFVPAPIHAGGLRYHGAAPMASALLDKGLISACAVTQNEAFEAAALFARTEGILPAPESSHAICKAVSLARDAAETGKEPCIVFGLSGHGHFDLAAYESYLNSELDDYQPTDEDLALTLNKTPDIEGGA